MVFRGKGMDFYSDFNFFFARSRKKPRLMIKKTAIIITPVRMLLVMFSISPKSARPQTVAIFSITS